MSAPTDINHTPVFGEYVAKCPECGATAIGVDGEAPPGHLHELGTPDQFFVEYERVDETKLRTRGRRPRAEATED